MLKTTIYGNIKSQVPDKSKIETSEKDIYLFISFDLVDSTVFKTSIENKDNWQYVILYFYEIFISEMSTILDKMFVWKYIGDEIVSCAKIKNIDELYDVPRKTFELQKNITKKINENFKLKNELNIKETLWLAPVTSSDTGDIQKVNSITENKSDIYRNIRITLNNGKFPTDDFLGPDIDIGFRIAKYAHSNKLTLSAEYAYLILQMATPKKSKHDEKDKIKIVSFENLKGVWDNRAYPIIWYYDDWKNINFKYDEYKHNDIIKYIDNKKELSYLETVFEQLNTLDEMNLFVEECKALN